VEKMSLKERKSEERMSEEHSYGDFLRKKKALNFYKRFDLDVQEDIGPDFYEKYGLKVRVRKEIYSPYSMYYVPKAIALRLEENKGVFLIKFYKAFEFWDFLKKIDSATDEKLVEIRDKIYRTWIVREDKPSYYILLRSEEIVKENIDVNLLVKVFVKGVHYLPPTRMYEAYRFVGGKPKEPISTLEREEFEKLVRFLREKDIIYINI
jgi:hypothetical protein